MNKNLNGFLFWAPRVLGILFILFVSLFALDVFEEGLDFWGTTLALLVHLLPSIAMATTLIIGWRWEWVGALGFSGFAIWYIAFTLNRGRFELVAYAFLVGIPLVIGILFLVGWVKQKNNRA